ncbi:TIGR04222 domain-containing membrane protein [Kibdelosporangium persicum]|uniref:TIGR04222 domain-containing membrane protein n=1 Tax=Kibdelosporangium persicum TaxID=2698649 RepID=A0ABX2FB30_9PSEU|nr:TIGR04222 domain-containing membrane protein [Kibdelosporangium persicum]NRN68497.1 TIGR04222 domain-containing membrane protein [Kibdelosporangium persicum]
MQNPWGLSGPDFIVLYAIGFVIACVATLVLRKRARSAPLAAQHEPLTADETAYLAGGWPRMVESTLADLVERNVIRVQRNGLLYPVADSGFVPESTLEDRLVSRVAGRPGRPLHYHLATLNKLPDYDQVRDDLVRRGLLFDGGTRGRAALAALPLFVLAVIGIARWINGVNLGFPVGYLSMLLILTLVTIVFALRPIKAGPTGAGMRALRDPSRGERSERAVDAVARHGLRAYPDVTISASFRESRVGLRSYDNGSTVSTGAAAGIGWSGGSSCSSGSSSGSSSSCGGGGGGCGGGGS